MPGGSDLCREYVTGKVETLRTNQCRLLQRQKMMGKNLNHFIACLLLLGLVLGAAPKIAVAEPVAVSYQGLGVFNLPVEIAVQRGFFSDQNLDVKLILTRPDVDRPALITGDIDFTLRGSSTVLSAARGLPVRMLFIGTLKPFWPLVVRREVNSVKELKGKVLGVAGMAGGHHIATRLVLKEYGLDPDKDAVYKIVPAGSRIPALESGAMDAGLLEYAEAYRDRKSVVEGKSVDRRE